MSDAFLNSYHLETSPYVVDTMTRNTISTDQDESKTSVPIVEREHLFNGTVENSNIQSNDEIPIQKDSNISVETAISFSKETMNILKTGSMLGDAETMLTNRFNRFSRYGYLDPTHEMVSGAREYLFFSKPDLHLMDRSGGSVILNPQLEGNPFFKEAFRHYRFSMYSLQQWYGESSRPFTDFDAQNKFIPLLSNMVSSSLDLPGISANEVQGNQNLYQVNTSYREGSITSDLQYDFSLEFKDTKYLDVYMFFKIYDEYFRYKYEENITPNRDLYSEYRILPEAFSVWKVIVDDTGRIIYWAKAIGVTAMSVPRDTLSNLDGTIKFTVNFKAQFIKDMDPVHLLELNNLSNLSMKSNVRYAYAKDITRENWVGYPIIRMKKGIGSTNNSFVRTGDADSSDARLYRLMWVIPQ